ncbi:hypothetical protein [Bdellovibrio sp. HCB2-146]|uniref:hypothetical protein n=1 Tax=Bdellovibrio sp. HCB2-146 TaxID=3394362 RepID=UPI0039BD2EC9
MDQLNKILILGLVLIIAGCGVKGRPLPPLTPAPLGRGEPTYSEATKKKSNKKSNPDTQAEEQTPYPEDEP